MPPWRGKNSRVSPDPLRGRLVELVGESEAERQIRVWQTMLAVLDKGELRPTHLHGEKEGRSR